MDMPSLVPQHREARYHSQQRVSRLPAVAVALLLLRVHTFVYDVPSLAGSHRPLVGEPGHVAGHDFVKPGRCGGVWGVERTESFVW